MSRPPYARPDRRDADDAPVWIYGRHAVASALRNSQRKMRRIYATRNALDWLLEEGIDPRVEPSAPKVLDAVLPVGAVHQGIAAQFDQLPRARLKAACSPDAPGPVLVLDQVTDPQNIGALFRVAAAFGAQAMIAQDRRTPPLAGALAKAAAGTIETVPLVEVVNIARSLEALRDMGFAVLGLAGDAPTPLPAYRAKGPVALVMGAEGKGLRELVRAGCTDLVQIPMAPGVESLNVSTAAAIALYAVTTTGRAGA